MNIFGSYWTYPLWRLTAASKTHWPSGAARLAFQQVSAVFFDESGIWCFALTTKNECLDIGHYLLLNSLRRHSSFEQYPSGFLGAGSTQFIDQELIYMVGITIHRVDYRGEVSKYGLVSFQEDFWLRHCPASAFTDIFWNTIPGPVQQ